MGAVGPNDVVTVTNEKFIIHTRNGEYVSIITLDDFWSTTLVGGAAPSTFDPKILYDRFNDRFIIVSQANSFDPTSATLVAVSQTGDPAGTYNRYVIDADAAAIPAGGKWADYPSIGFNKNWITVQVNLFGYGTASGYQGPAVYVLDKAAAYNNTLGTVSTFVGDFATCLGLPAVDQFAALDCGFTMVPAVTEDNTTTSLYLAEDWDSTAAQLRLSEITGTPAAPVLTVGYQFPQGPNSWRFDAALAPGASGGYMLQRQQNAYLLSGNRVTANDSRIQKTVLRNGSLWAVHHVMLPTIPTPAGAPASTVANPDNHTAVQWWEIDPTIAEPLLGTAPIEIARIEDPTADNCHNGTGGTRAGCVPQGQFFAFANIAVNQNDDVVIGYSRFSNLTLPKCAYSFRAGTDAVNTMRDSQTFREGVGNYNIGAGMPFTIRWGDYSAVMVDPVNDTDFWTTQEFADFQREIFGPGGFAGVWATQWAQIKPGSPTTTGGNLIISEFRLVGPAGPRDEFVELYNPSDSPLTVTTTDGSDGWAVAHSTTTGVITTMAAIPNGTTIPGHGHYLVTNEVAAAGINPYSLRAYPSREIRDSDGDAMYTPDLAGDGGIAIFRTANPANFAAGNRMDSVGFAGVPAGLYKEGAGLPPIAGAPFGQISFIRKEFPTGFPQDTQDNAADFLFVDSSLEVLGVTPLLGFPGPQNVDSPIHNNQNNLTSFPLDPSVSNQSAPNAVYDPTPDVPNNSSLGTLTLRRTFVNNTGAPITRLRYRVVDITAGPASAGTADLRVRASTAQAAVPITGVNPACPGGTCDVKRTILELAIGVSGGGLDSSLFEDVILLATPLAPGAATNVNFLLGVEQTGTYRFAVIAEGLPPVGGSFVTGGCVGPAGVCNAASNPTVLINDVSVTEGNAGTINASFTVSLSAASTNAVFVDYATANGSAQAPGDYTATSGSLTFQPGETSKTVNVPVKGDTLYENTESFVLNLSNVSGASFGDSQGRAFIINDDTAPSLSIDDVAVAEGNGGSTTATFTVTLSTASGRTTTVDYSTANGTATTPEDYSGVGGTLTFLAGETSKTIAVSVNGDTTFEPNETFFINLMNATNATLSDAQGQGTITNDDSAPTPTATATATPAAQALNVSTRMRTDAGNNAAIGGFTITGGAPKHVLVRALGPSLTKFGFGAAEVLADPTLELHGPGAFGTITNNNWRDSQEAQIKADGLPPTNDLEAAIDATLPPGAYTAIIQGNSGTPPAGICTFEVYDLDTAAASKLANLSSRAFVGTGNNVVIAGFVLGNNPGNDRIVVRGLGPSLAAFGIANTLADPTLELRDENGVLLASNNDWQDDPAQATEISADGLAPTNTKEAAIAATLPPGLYTAILAGLNNSTGVGTVEVYDLGP